MTDAHHPYSTGGPLSDAIDTTRRRKAGRRMVPAASLGSGATADYDFAPAPLLRKAASPASEI